MFHKFIQSKQGKEGKSLQQVDNKPHAETYQDQILDLIEINQVMELGKRYNVRQSAILPITENLTAQNLVLIVSGYQVFEVVVTWGEKAHEEVFREKVYLYDVNKQYFVPIHQQHLQQNKGGKIVLFIHRIEGEETQDKVEKFVLFRQFDFFELPLYEQIELATNFTNEVRFKIPTNKRNPTHQKYVFYARTETPFKPHEGDEIVDILINYNSSFPSADS